MSENENNTLKYKYSLNVEFGKKYKISYMYSNKDSSECSPYSNYLDVESEDENIKKRKISNYKFVSILKDKTVTITFEH